MQKLQINLLYQTARLEHCLSSQYYQLFLLGLLTLQVQQLPLGFLLKLWKLQHNLERCPLVPLTEVKTLLRPLVFELQIHLGLLG